MYRISYKPLAQTLTDRKWNKGDLQKATGLSSATIAKISKNESVTMNVIGRICEALKCSISGVVEIIDDSSTEDHDV